MIEDFDSGANALWSLYRSEANGRDKSRIETLKDDMDGVLIFFRPCPIHHITDLIVLIHIPRRPVYFLLLWPPS